MFQDHGRRYRMPAGFGVALAAAPRSRGRAQRKQGTRGQRAPAGSSGVRFHAPSFSGGIILGALLVLVVAYLPELTGLLSDREGRTAEAASSTSTNAAAPAEPTIRFEFEELLSSSEVTTAAGRYADADDDVSELYLQAASFRTQEEADRLRADLLLLNLPTSTSPVDLADGRWIRVTVGPFRSPVHANRAMTTLRNRNIAPIWIKRKATG
ncbi:MAG: SPOR domain-containing protein [Pseudomonadota bacterium]